MNNTTTKRKLKSAEKRLNNLIEMEKYMIQLITFLKQDPEMINPSRIEDIIFYYNQIIEQTTDIGYDLRNLRN